MTPGELVADRFRIEGEAGRGGMSVVWRARDLAAGGRLVALKVLSLSGLRDRFEREAQILAALRHPAIVGYVASGVVDGAPWLAMEWLEGEDLAERIKRTGLTVPEALAVVCRVSEALAVAHRQGVVHRDIKPSNVFLEGRDLARVRLLDFGVARRAFEARELTQTGAALGTPSYMSPEQVRGSGDVDARSDVFALACLLYKCIAGRTPFTGADAVAVVTKIVLEPPPRLSELAAGVPEELDELCLRMLSKEPAGRPADAAAALAELEAIVPGEVFRATPVPEAPAALTTAERRLVCVVIAEGALPEEEIATQVVGAVPALHETNEAPATVLLPVASASVDTGLALRRAVTAHAGHMEVLSNGTVVATLTRTGAATDLASRGARLALAIHDTVPTARLALSLGLSEGAERVALGDLIDRAAALLAGSADPPGTVLLDAVSAGLVRRHFLVERDGARGVLRSPRRPTLGARTVLGVATAFVGRDRELGTLYATYGEAVDEPASRCVVVTGPAGIGKSRLVDELVTRASREAPRPSVFTSRGDPVRAASPFGLVAQMLASAAAIHADDPLVARQEALRARVSRSVAPADRDRVTEFLAELVGAPFAEEGRLQLRTARASAIVMGDQMARAFQDFLAAECALGPVVLALDDVQWGDVPSIRFVLAALQNLADLPLFVVVAARPEARAAFPALFAARGVVALELAPLGKRAAERLVTAALAEPATPDELARLVRHGAGNPLWLEEIVRAVADGRGAELPETVLAMAQARIEGLEAEARRTLRAASVLGVVFWRGAVLSLVGGLEQTTALDEWLEELCARELVVRRGEGAYAGEVEYAFAQVLVRDAAYAMLTDRDKKLGHRLAASWLEAAGSPDAMALAEHYQRGDEPARAVRFYLRAARQALEGNDFEATVARVALGVAAAAEGGAPEDIVGALHLHAAEAHRWQGRTPEAERAAREAVQRLPRATPAWFSALGELATAFGRLADKARLAEVGRLLLSVAPAPGAELARNTAAVQAIVQLFHLGGGDLGREMLATIFAPMGGAELSDPAVAAAHAVAHMSAAMSGGDHGACMAWAREAVSAFELAGDRRSACMQRVNVGYSAMEIGAYEASERILREALADAEHMGLAVAAMIARQNLGLVLCHRADPGARAMELEAVAAGDAQKLRFFSGAARAYLAIIEAHDGELEAAEATAREAVRLLEVAPPTLVFARGVLADVLRARGKIDEALATAREAIAELERLGSIEEGESRVRLGYATALWATRDEAATRAAFATARARLLERAGNIRDEEQRRSFLENVPENAETLAHARFWLGA